MNEDCKVSSQYRLRWGSTGDLDKGEKREILFRETGNCCMICGKPRTATDEWSMAQIIPERKPKYVLLDGRTIICHECTLNKGWAPIPLYASSRSFKNRLEYWLRVQSGYREGLISAEKKALFFKGFSLFHRFKDNTVKKGVIKYMDLLAEETSGTCIYCGKPLIRQQMTYDHIYPKSRGGKSVLENYVLACSDCNNSKGDTPVDVYVRDWQSEKKRTRFANRVNDLVRAGRLPERKAKVLLSYQNEKVKHFQFRLFNRVYRITFTRTKV